MTRWKGVYKYPKFTSDQKISKSRLFFFSLKQKHYNNNWSLVSHRLWLKNAHRQTHRVPFRVWNSLIQRWRSEPAPGCAVRTLAAGQHSFPLWFVCCQKHISESTGPLQALRRSIHAFYPHLTLDVCLQVHAAFLGESTVDLRSYEVRVIKFIPRVWRVKYLLSLKENMSYRLCCGRLMSSFELLCAKESNWHLWGGLCPK